MYNKLETWPRGSPLSLAEFVLSDLQPHPKYLDRNILHRPTIDLTGRLPLCLLLLALFYWLGAWQHLERVNLDIMKGDQRAYLTYARSMAQSNYEFVGGRNRMPVFPFLLSLVYEDGLSVEDFFVRGKHLGVVLSMLSLVAIGLVVRRWLPRFETMALVLITAFGFFVYRSAYVKSEILFYTATFFAFLFALRMLHRPSLGLAALTGTVLGVAHLIKSSVLPMLALILAWAGAAAVVELACARREKRRLGECWRRVAAPALVALCFLTTVFPYSRTSHERFGHWFYNVNSTFYVWCDSWEEAEENTKAHGDRKHWPDMRAEDIPGPGKYLQEHSVRQIGDRVTGGLAVLWKKQRAEATAFLFIYLLLGTWVARRAPEKMREVLFAEGRWVVTGFVSSFLVSYLLLFAFYTPIASGQRLVMALYLPALFSLMYLCSRPEFTSLVLRRSGATPLVPERMTVWALRLLAVSLVTVYPARILTKYYGD